MKIRVGIDIQATEGPKTGLGVYTENLTRELKRLNPDGFSWHFLERGKRGDLNTFQRLYWENVERPTQIKKQSLDLLHIPAFAPPYKKECRWVVTIHDLIGKLFPNQRGLPSRFYWGHWLPWTVRQAEGVIADSEHTKIDILKHLGIPESKIRVVYPSGHEGFAPEYDGKHLEILKKKFGITKPYFLFVGTIEPRKNLKRVIEAFARFKKGGEEFDYQLVVVGSRQFAYGETFRSLVAQVRLDSRDLVFADFLAHSDLHHLYCGATAFLFPSLYEGFGIPVLEAMACGIPVIASNVTSIPEVAGDAALLVDPLKVEDLADAMKRLHQDKELRRELKAKGFIRIRQFSWEKTARETLRVYETVMRHGA